MIVTRKLSEVPIMETSHNVDARNIYSTEEAMITVITLKPGQSLKRHITPVDVAFFVLQGEGKVLIGDETKIIFANELVESPKGIVHCWYNESSEDLTFIVVKAPRPTAKTVFIS